MGSLVSVILPSNKSSNKIVDSLLSLVDESLDGVEYLVNLDNVSGSVRDQILNLGIPSLKITTHSGSLAEVLNILVASATGEYIARADDDDLYSRGRLISQVEYLEYRKDIHVVGAAMHVRSQDKLVGKQLYPATHDEICLASLFANNAFAHPVVMARASFFKTQHYRNLPAEDFDLWARGMIGGFRYANLEVPLFTYTLPSYSASRMRAMSECVVQTVHGILSDFFLIKGRLALELTSIFCSNVRCDLPLETQQELLGIFLGRIAEIGFGKNALLSVSARYSPKVFELLRTI